MAPTYPDESDRDVRRLYGARSTISSETGAVDDPGPGFRYRAYCRRGGGRAILTLLAEAVEELASEGVFGVR
jgi:hypothetical protein